MATQPAKIAGGNKKNDGGTAVNAGTPESSSPITDVLNPNQLNTGNEYGSKVVGLVGTSGDFVGVTTAFAAGSGGLAYTPDPRAGDASGRNFIIRGAGDSAARINNSRHNGDILVVGGSDFGDRFDGVAGNLKTTNVGFSSGTFLDVLAVPSTDMVPGRTKAANAGVSQAFVAPSGAGETAGTDAAANPTRAVPGELTYHFGGLAAPTTDEYKAKDSAE